MDRRGDIIRFGVDGWRARFDDGFDAEGVARVADALGLVWGDSAPGSTVYVGYDTRHASREFALLVAGVLSSYGLVVRLSDEACPTPAVAWSCAHDESACGAVVVTASELSCEYGGLLVRGSDGGPVSRGFLESVEQAISLVPTQGRGAFEECDLVGPYLDELSSRVDGDSIARRAPRIVVDAMCGAGTAHLARVLRGLGCDVIEMHVEPREDFGGIHPDPRDPWADACEQAVVAQGADMGLLLDGDADRAAVVDERGNLLPARVLVPMLLGNLVMSHGERGRVVTTLTCSACIYREAARLGCEVTPAMVCRWNQNAGLLGTAGTTQLVKIWNLETEQLACCRSTGEKTPVVSLLTEEAGGFLCGLKNGRVLQIDMRMHDVLPLFQSPQNGAKLVGLEETSEYLLATAEFDGWIRFFDRRNASAAVSSRFLTPALTSLASQPALSMLVTTSLQSELRVMDGAGETKQIMRAMKGFRTKPLGNLLGAAIHPLSGAVACFNARGVVCVYE